MTSGTVRKTVTDRRYGFITADDSTDYFFHRDGVDSSTTFEGLLADARVEFDIEAGPKGPRAVNVRAAA
jgi:CspA family cold shock protein